MNQAEVVLFEELVPLLDRAAEDLGKHIDGMAFNVLARRLASRGYDWDDLEDEVRRHFDHQINYENRMVSRSVN